MRKERVFNLETESQIKEFLEKIDDGYYYIDKRESLNAALKVFTN